MAEHRKLIEVALPLVAINRAAAREKSIRHGHPSTLHLWWARRPLATARAVLFAQLVDDPDSRPEAEAFEDSEERAAWVSGERARLFRLVEELVKWENSANEGVLARARDEIMKSTNDCPPAILDPFAGGGTIPLEAQRLGLKAHASDLNPVAVLINKALIEIPPKFAGLPPIFPGAADSQMGAWPRSTGLAEDVRRYGKWMRDEAEKRVGHLYPKAKLPDGSSARVIAWIWTRTVACPNPACGIEMPLVRSWSLNKMKGREAYVVPQVVDGTVQFKVRHDPNLAPPGDKDGTMSGRRGAVCVSCNSAADMNYIKKQGQSGQLGSRLLAIVAEGVRQRVYLDPTPDHELAAAIARPTEVPTQDIGHDPRNLWTPSYGLSRFADLFTNRQLELLKALSDLVHEARERVRADALTFGMPASDELQAKGADASAYSDAVATMLGIAVSRSADRNNSVCTWDSGPSSSSSSTGGSARTASVRNAFARQALPMTWDYAEANAFSESGGSFESALAWIVPAIDRLGTGIPATVLQDDARTAVRSPGLISTDPPYYDNIGYSDLSDFFYVWLRRSLREIYPDLLSTLLVPKAEELVANPYRNSGRDGAREYFESGFREVFAAAREGAYLDFPITVYYAYKQSEAKAGSNSSTGWQTLLDGLVRGGWCITGTWPMRSEMSNRILASGTNALASSIVLALRPRMDHAPVVDRRTFVRELRDSLPTKLRELQQGSIAAVDLPQSAIGPGMAIFTHYSKVVESDGSSMTVGSALEVINQVLGEVLWQQEGDFDASTRWCVKWFESNGFDEGTYGDAETLASAYNTSVKGLERSGALTSAGGVVQLFSPQQLTSSYDPRTDDHTTLWEVVLQLAKALADDGLDAAGRMMSQASTRIDLDAAKELAYLIFSIADDKRWSGVAQLFNLLAASWSDIVDAARRTAEDMTEQLTLEATY